MNEEHDKAWKELAKRVCKGERHVISGEAAERLFRALPDERILQADMDTIVEAVVSGRPLRDVCRPEATPGLDDAMGASTKQVEKDVLQLNRNKGQQDAEAESLLDKLRREALDDEGEGDDGNRGS